MKKKLNLAKYIMLRQIHGENNYFSKHQYCIILPRNWKDIEWWVE